MNRRQIAHVLFLFLIFELVVPSQAYADKPLVKIGIILPLSGELARTGAAFRDAAILALEDAPKERFEYQLIFEDDALQAGKAITAAQKLIRVDQVDALVSTWSYGGAVVSPLAERAKVLHFGVAWDPVVSKGRFNFQHLTPPEEFISKIFAAFKGLGYHSFSSVAVAESGAVFAVDELERLAPESGLQALSRDIFQFGEVDFRPVLLKTSKLRPDVFYFNGVSPQIDLFLKQMAELKINTPVVAMTGFDVMQDLRPIEGRWYVTDTYVTDDLKTRMRERFGHHEVYGIGNYYDIVKLYVYLFEHSREPSKVSAESLLPDLRDLSGFPSLFGTLKVSEEGVVTYPARYMRIKNGQRIPTTLEDIVAHR